jgi:hypothetical protein
MDTEEVAIEEETFSPDPTFTEVVNLLKSQKDELAFQLDLAQLTIQKLKARLAELESMRGQQLPDLLEPLE